MSKRSRKADLPHIRLYAWEMKCDAWKSLSTDARALLIEIRALWNADNRIYLSVRQMMERLGIGQRRATAARDELLERGWIRQMEAGSFNRKVRHATVFAATHESIHPNKTPPKDYARWKP